MIKNSYKALVLTILTFACLNSSAQSDEDAIKRTINNMFDGMRKTDTALIRSAFSPVAILQTIARNRDGATVIRTDAVDSFVVSIARPRTEVLDERISFETIKIDGDLAIAWTPYKFYVGEKFSHCGVNSFQLVRLN